MRVGQRSLIWGVHQFLWHPLTVLLAWWSLYGTPNWREAVCILIHDWGYWFCSDMDGPQGEKHPEFAAQLAGQWFGPEYRDLCLYHSRHYARLAGRDPSRLCWSDKYSVIFEPWWFYLLRAWAGGELKEYRQNAARDGVVPLAVSHREWHMCIRNLFISQAKEKYMNVVF
ncbi:MAG: hypothetical protein JL50_08310 [Peptococcaceae bacterium BICA1-7]|nr:MAG: hypothetical protein JL50_08310 [Peptococcaceae bacterium BICA1-7]HBV97435.1 hypothetical protein [Desulfotomaculum sp.]